MSESAVSFIRVSCCSTFKGELMKQIKYTALLSMLALLFSVCAFARDKNQHSVEISESVQVGGTQLTPGTYKVEWQGSGPEIQVNFVRDGKTVATSPGRSERSISRITKNHWSLSRAVCSSLTQSETFQFSRSLASSPAQRSTGRAFLLDFL